MARKTTEPETIADDSNAAPSIFLILSNKSSPQDRREFHYVENVAGCEGARDPFGRLPRQGCIEARSSKHGHVLENVVLRSPVHVVWIGDEHERCFGGILPQIYP